MKKFIIDSIPLIAGITIALIVATLFTGSYKNNKDSTSILEDDIHQIEYSLSEDAMSPSDELTYEDTMSSDKLTSSDDFVSSETISEETESEPTEEISQDSPPIAVDEFDYIPMSQSLKDHVKLVSSFYGFDEELIYQIIYIESRFNPTARNGICVGLMQVNTKYSPEYLKINDGLPFEVNENSDVYDPYVNIVVGIRVLDDWRRMGSGRGFKELNDWLCYYNMGWRYEDHGSNGYDQLVLRTDLSSIDFSRYKIVE